MMQDPRMAVDAQGPVATAPPPMPQSQVPLQMPQAAPQGPSPQDAAVAIINAAKSGDAQAYAEGVKLGIFDARLSPAAAAWQAQINLGGSPQGAPSSILKELQDYAKLTAQEQSLQQLLPEQQMQGMT